MADRIANLQRLFAPNSVAVFGASAAAEKAGYQALAALADFAGPVYPINPRAETILGRRVYPSLSAVGQPIDLVLFVVPAGACVAGVEEAIATGCGGGVIMSGGFAETGTREGAAMQERIRELCARSGFRLLGPNTAGFFNKGLGLIANFAAGIDRIRPGDVGVVAQSGGINLIASFLVDRLGGGVSCGIGLGNAADIDAADALEFLALDPGTRAIALHLEGVKQGRRLHDTLRRVTPLKPVVALPVGRHEIGEFARSHTGNLIGSYDLKVAALRQAGAVVVDSTDDLAVVAGALALARVPARRAPGIGVLVGQAGAGLIVLDRLKSAGARVPALGQEALERIGALLPPMTYIKNPVDTGRPGPAFADVLTALAADGEIDAVAAFALHEPATLQPEEALPAARARTSKPIVFGTMGPEAEVRRTAERLRAQGIFTAPSPERLARAAAALAEDAAGQWRLAQAADSAAAHAMPALAPGMDEHAAKQALAACGIAVPRGAACATRAEASAAFRAFGGAVVAKILSGEVVHKTEAGGVHLGIADDASLAGALDALERLPLRGPRRYLIEEMAPAGLELIVGAVRDPSFGPTVMVGLGGTLAEAIRDTATRLAPLSLAEAHEMLSSLRGARLLDGWRGAPKVDRDAVAHVIVRLGALLAAAPAVREIEINPLRVYPQGVLALDALVA